MKKREQDYNEDLKRDIYEFYLSKKELCDKRYNMAESESLGTIYKTIEDEEEIRIIYTKISMVILTANKYEKNVLHAAWNSETNKEIQRISIHLFPQRDKQEITYAYYFCWHNQDILHIESMVTGSYTIGGSADIIRYVTENTYLQPTTIISLGVCFGVDEKEQTLGDTIISEKVYPYFMAAKYNERNYLVSDNNMFSLHNSLHSKIKSEILDLNIFNGLEFEVSLGNYITGEAVISNKMIRDQFAGITTQKILAGDMEGYGLFKECCGRDYVIPCVIIKSICDWAVLKNLYDLPLFQRICGEKFDIDSKEVKTMKERLQAYASYNAYCVLERMLKQGIFKFPIYKRFEEKIKETPNEKIIHIERIRKILKPIAKDSFAIRLTNTNVLYLCKVLVRERILSEIENVNKSKTWKINGR